MPLQRQWPVLHSRKIACSFFDPCEASVLQDGVERVKEYLLSSAGDAAICMVCLDEIRHADAVWSCHDSCYAIMHLQCIQVSGRLVMAGKGTHVCWHFRLLL